MHGQKYSARIGSECMKSHGHYNAQCQKETAVSNISNTQFHGIDLTKMIYLSKEKNCKKTFAVFYTVSS
jgi:hypothetical protein